MKFTFCWTDPKTNQQRSETREFADNTSPAAAFLMGLRAAGAVDALIAYQATRFVIGDPVQTPESGPIIIEAPKVRPTIPAGVTAATLRKTIEGVNLITQKIKAIKAIRELVDLGLADAKWAVENWAAFIAFVEKNDRVPEPGFSYQPMR